MGLHSSWTEHERAPRRRRQPSQPATFHNSSSSPQQKHSAVAAASAGSLWSVVAASLAPTCLVFLDPSLALQHQPRHSLPSSRSGLPPSFTGSATSVTSTSIPIFAISIPSSLCNHRVICLGTEPPVAVIQVVVAIFGTFVPIWSSSSL
ncbi:hypothetical protein PIB30_011757 [Stylosanthes scabra]|uniref:Uncharacterized protein n=1 Tax=Stylosanthes scabra TaxID=79078 RepID=A0ABU6Q6M9_9FABA|nr:hypothetical protein [Stylosanthes scabra]